MQLLIDSADLAAIRHWCGVLAITGVTTNPTILARESDPLSRLREIRDTLAPEQQLHVQVTATETDAMVAQGTHLVRRLGDVFVKVPVTENGYRAMKRLVADGIQVTATAVYTAFQGFAAIQAGAAYAAPYVNRIFTMGGDGLEVAITLHEMLVAHGLEGNVLGASFKSAHQVAVLAEAGIGACTVAPDVLAQIIAHPATEPAVTQQNADLAERLGERSMLDL